MSISRRKFAHLLGAGAAAAFVRPAFCSAKLSEHIGATGGVVRLSANENPYGPSPKALKAMTDSFSLTCRYPDEHNNVLIDRLARLNGVNHDQILLGGLLSSYQLTSDKRLLSLAEDLGNRLLPVFNSPTGMPYAYVNLRTGQTRGAVTNPAETGTLLLEFGTLSKLTGRPVFYEKAKRALVETFKRRSQLGLVGQSINVETGAWTNTDSHISGGIDSYYEYLWKCWLLFGDNDCRGMWEASIPAVNKYLADETRSGLWYGHAEMQTGKRTETTYGALDAFFPGLLALSGDLARARRLQASSFKMWDLHGIEPEILDYKTMHVIAGSYHLRPEIIESTYYLYHYTGDPEYRQKGEKLFDDFVKYCRTESGYAALADVTSKQQLDEMESFVLAETFKYFYLLFAPAETLEFDKVIFNTEAHPLRRIP